jgi:ferric enterobactin receptor
MSDVFKTRYNAAYSSNQYFTQEYKRISNPQLVRLNLSYNFGKVDALLFKRKTRGAETDGD